MIFIRTQIGQDIIVPITEQKLFNFLRRLKISFSIKKLISGFFLVIKTPSLGIVEKSNKQQKKKNFTDFD